MNRKDFQALANLRLREARALLRANEFSGAYYLAGYGIECGLKACIARGVRKHDFYPSRKTVEKAYTHNLNDLAAIANLDQDRASAAQTDPIFAANWNLVVRWSEASRYSLWDEQACRELVNAIIDKDHGVMPWLKKHW